MESNLVAGESSIPAPIAVAILTETATQAVLTTKIGIEVAQVPSMSFSDLHLSKELCKALADLEITTPSPIQAKTIIPAVEGRDILGVAQTGTGKTFAFVLPILEKLSNQEGQALIIVPTRELAIQVDEAISSVSRNLSRRLRSVVLIGGTPMRRQMEQLARRPRIVVATPGRLNDHLDRGTLNLRKTNTIVLDEADRMFDMGFAPQIKNVLELLPPERQTMFFSATMPPEIATLANRHLRDPFRVEITPAGTGTPTVDHEVCYVDRDKKNSVLKQILTTNEGRILVFSRTKHGASSISRSIHAMGIAATEIHSNRNMSQRSHSIQGFRSGKYQVLVATDIASRGIDVNDVKLVINFDLPQTSEDYVHRSGRAGRAGKHGKAISLVTSDEFRDIKRIEKSSKIIFGISPLSIEPPKASQGGNGGGQGGRGRPFRRGGGGGNRGPRAGGGGGGGRRFSRSY